MGQHEVNAPVHDDGADSAAEADINLATVLVVLAVLVGLVALMFWLLPTWFGSTSITVNVRN